MKKIWYEVQMAEYYASAVRSGLHEQKWNRGLDRFDTQEEAEKAQEINYYGYLTRLVKVTEEVEVLKTVDTSKHP
jgi:hypothetical protein